MHKQTLKNILQYNINATFEDFCYDIFFDFDPSRSRGYLSGKYGMFQKRFILFLAELDESHLERLSYAILRRYGSDDPDYCDIVEKAEIIIARDKASKCSPEKEEEIARDAEMLLADELYPFAKKLDDEEREMEFEVIQELIERIGPIAGEVL